MTPAEVAFLRRLANNKPVTLRHEGVAVRMLANHQLGRQQGSRVAYTERDFESAANMLLNRQHALAAPLAPFKRSQAPSGGSEKTGALPVTHGLVGVVPLHMDHALRVPVGALMVMPWGNAMALPFEALLVCENLEPMLELHRYTWLNEFVRGRATLAIFRGAPGLLRPDAPAQLMAADSRPVLAFFDFDPKGLSMAAALARREALCLPPWPHLEASARAQGRTDLFSTQAHVCRPHLDRVDEPDVALAWQRMKALSCGLDQEHFPGA